MWTYEDLIPSLIANTTMQKGINANGVHKNYCITPVDGYVLHDTVSDTIDENDNLILGYCRGTVTCGASYDFTENPREFYAVPENSVPADQIFGGEDNDHEVM